MLAGVGCGVDSADHAGVPDQDRRPVFAGVVGSVGVVRLDWADGLSQHIAHRAALASAAGL